MRIAQNNKLFFVLRNPKFAQRLTSFSGGPVEPRIFTLKEANKIIPKIEPIIDGLIEKKKLMQKQHDELLVLDLLVGEDSKTEDTPEGKEYVEKSAELEALVLSFEDEILEINGRGCVLKDIDKGYVDFFTVKDKHLVCFCWHKGEKEVQYWHAVNDNYQNRKPL